FVTKDNIRRPAEIFIEERRQFIRLDSLDQRGEIGDIGKHGRDFAALAYEIEAAFSIGQALCEIGRKIALQGGVSALGDQLPMPGFAQYLDVANGLSDSGLEISEINWLRHKVERAAIHRGADITHIAIS